MKIKQLLRLLKLSYPYRYSFILSLIFSIINIVSTLLIPIYIGKAIDTLIGKNHILWNALFHHLIIIGVFTIILALSNYGLMITSNRLTFSMTHDLRKQLFHKFHHLPLKYLDGQSQGDLMTRMIADIDLIGDGLFQGFTNLFQGICTIIGTLIIMLMINVHIALIVIILTPLSILVSSFIASRTYSLFKTQLHIRGELSSFVQEMIQNQKIVKTFSHEKENQEIFDEINERLRVSGVKSQFLGALVNPSTRFVNAIVYGSVCVFGSLSVLQSTITIGVLSSFLTYANQYTKPFNDISNVFTELETALACFSRVIHLLDQEDMPEIKDPVNIDKIQGKVEFSHLSFSYQEKPFIEDFNLTANPGETIAIVGPTGCGKTTLINLLMRFYDPQKGTIYIDDIDMKKINKYDQRKFFGMVLQDTWLFKGTIRENIAFSKIDATDEEIIEAAKKAHVHDYIMQLGDKYDTMLSEDGLNLSLGQRQLICIARIMLSNCSMLILDEATSSIDTRTEKQISEAFDLLMQNKTTFIVAHRLSTILKADKIIVMKDGQIIEQGKHQELMNKQGFYAHLYESQFKGATL